VRHSPRACVRWAVIVSLLALFTLRTGAACTRLGQNVNHNKASPYSTRCVWSVLTILSHTCFTFKMYSCANLTIAQSAREHACWGGGGGGSKMLD